MSRQIISNHIDYSKEAVEEKRSGDGKILFTTYREKDCAILIKGNRILAMQPLFSEQNRIGTVYIGKVKNIAKEIHAAFVEIENGEICFLPEKDFPINNLANNGAVTLKQGDEIPVQIVREAHKTKQASVTANVNLTNDIAVVGPNKKNKQISYSEKISKEGKERLMTWVNEWVNHFENPTLDSQITSTDFLPNIVIRTYAEECDKEYFFQKLSELVNQFTELQNNAKHRTCFSRLTDSKPAFAITLEELADRNEYQEIVTENVSLYPDLLTYCNKNLPDKGVRLYEDKMMPLNKLYAVNTKAECAFNAQIWLKSGAYLVIEPTEALTVIDVNSGKYEGKKDVDNIFAINMEAASEIALQLRLRNLSGIIIVDFISMKDKTLEKELLAHLRTLVKNDRRKTTIVDITPLGLVEITRKRDKASLKEQFQS